MKCPSIKTDSPNCVDGMDSSNIDQSNLLLSQDSNTILTIESDPNTGYCLTVLMQNKGFQRTYWASK